MSWGARILLLVFGLGVGVATAEIVPRVFSWLMPRGFRGVERVYTGRARWEQMMVADPDLGYRPRPDLDFQFPSEGRKIPIRTTSHGLGDVGFRDIGTTSPFEAIAIGDSFTFCDDVPADACWVRQLGALTGLRIGTLGVSGYSTLAEARLLARYGPALAPRLVIQTVFPNDFMDNVLFERWRESGTADFWTWRAQQEGRSPLRRWLADRSVVYRLAEVGLRGWDDKTVPYQKDGLDLVFRVDRWWLGAADGERAAEFDRGWALMKQALGDVKTITERLGAHLLVVLIPMKEEVYWDRLRTRLPGGEASTAESPLTVVRQFCAAGGLACCDLTEALGAEAHRGGQVYFRVSGHWNDAGNAVAARAIAACLAERGWAPAVAGRTGS